MILKAINIIKTIISKIVSTIVTFRKDRKVSIGVYTINASMKMFFQWMISAIAGLMIIIVMVLSTTSSDIDLLSALFNCTDIINIVVALELAALTESVYNDDIKFEEAPNQMLDCSIIFEILWIILGVTLYCAYELVPENSELYLYSERAHINGMYAASGIFVVLSSAMGIGYSRALRGRGIH